MFEYSGCSIEEYKGDTSRAVSLAEWCPLTSYASVIEDACSTALWAREME